MTTIFAINTLIIDPTGKLAKGQSLVAEDVLFVSQAGGFIDGTGDGIIATNLVDINLDGIAAGTVGVQIKGGADTLVVNGQAEGVSDGVVVIGSKDLTKIGETGTVDGSAASSVGIDIDGNSDTLVEDGQVEGAKDGVTVTGSSDLTSIGGAGTVDGIAAGSVGVAIDGSSDTLAEDGQVEGAKDGVTVTGSNDIMNIGGTGTVDGMAASSAGVDISGSSNTLAVDGQVEGATEGVIVSGSGDIIKIGARGTVEGLSNAGFGIELTGSTGDSLVNGGDIFGVNAIYVDDSGGDSIVNTGAVAGPTGIWLLDNDSTPVSIGNSGTIEGENGGFSVGIVSRGSSAGVEIVNSGLITNNGANGAGSDDAVIRVDDDSGTTTTIDNKGSIVGSGYAIQSDSDILDISNSGTIHGGLYSVASVAVDNAGLWKGQAGSAVVVFDLTHDDDDVTNSHTGAIDGGITLVGGGDALTNAGGIDGAITFTGTGATNTVTNSGEITGNIAFSGESSALANSGAITANLTLTSDNVLTNAQAGAIDGAISLGLSDRFDNAGKIDGAISLTAGDDTLTNSGDIDGSITDSSTGSKLSNSGHIYGDVSLGVVENLTNTGVIHGDLTLGTADTINPGDVTGAISASTNDLIEFSGNFGNVTIDSFVAGTVSSDDTIQFAANDFGSFTAVQSAMTQVGSDVVIKLDTTDSITLAGVTLSSLVAADFKFV